MHLHNLEHLLLSGLIKIDIISFNAMKWYVFVIFLVTGLSVAGFLVIFFNIDPYESANQARYLFFTALFMAIWGFGTLLLNRFKLKIDWPDFYESFKMSFIISLILCLGIFIIRYVRY